MVRAAVPPLTLLPFGLTRRVFPWLSLVSLPLIGRQIRVNLDLAYGDELAPDEKRKIARQVAFNLGLVVAEVLALIRDALPDDYLDDTEAYAALRDLVDQGKGVIAMTSHSGNWELLGWWFMKRSSDHAGAAIADRNANTHLQKIIESMRSSFGLATIYQDESLRRSVRLLKQGRIIATVPDQDVRRIGGSFVDFFGQPAYTPTGPAAMALLSGAPIILICSRRRKYGLVLDAHEVLRADPGRPRQDEIERLTRSWCQQLEQQIRKQPGDWMWMHRRWKTTPDSLRARHDTMAPAPEDATKADAG